MIKYKKNWDLKRYFYNGINDEKLNDDIEKVKRLNEKFVKKYKGKIEKFEAKDFVGFLEDENELSYLSHKIGIYLSLASSLDTQNQSFIKKSAELDNIFTEISNENLFVLDELKKIGSKKIEEFSNNPLLKNYKNHLFQTALNLRYSLDNNTERALNYKDPNMSVIMNMFEEITGNLRFKIKIGEKTKVLNNSEIRKYFYSSDEKLRKKAYYSVKKIYDEKNMLITFGNIYRTILKDWSSEIKIRKYPGILSQRIIMDQISQNVIITLIETVEKAYPLYQKYLKLKAKLLGKKKLKPWDVGAPISKKEKKISFDEGLKIYLDTIDKFDKEFYDYSVDMLENGRVDIYPEKNKRGGAFAEYHKNIPSFILLNQTDTLRDVLTLTHELGHAIHGHLSQVQNGQVFISSYSLAETASTFNEVLVAENLKNKLEGKEKLEFIAKYLEELFAAIFVQIQYTTFEKEVHEKTLNGIELTYDDFCEIWKKHRSKLVGNSIDAKNPSYTSWAGIHHFYMYPFYCYNYSFGNLLGLSFYEEYLKNGDTFVKKYKEILSSGGNDTTINILKKHGFNVEKKEFYERGIEYIEGLLEEFEKMITN
jgi:oligoendopeptidase F